MMMLDYPKVGWILKRNLIIISIMQIPEREGSRNKWSNSTKMILNPGTTSIIILNGVLGKVIHYRRGATQGDPLSPLLFIYVSS